MLADTATSTEISRLESWVQHIDEFLRFLGVERRASEHTVRSYRHSLTLFVKDSAPPRLKQVRIEHVRDHVIRLRELQLSSSSIAQHLSSLRSFFRFHVRNNRLSHNPAEHVRAPKIAQRLPRVLDVDAAIKLVGQTFAGHMALRNHALLELLYSSGMRLSEIVGLNVEDVDLRSCQASVLGKGKKQRIVPVGSHAIEALKRWLASREGCGPSHPLFTGRKGSRIARRTVQDIVKKAGLTALEDDGVHPHLL